MRGLLKVAIVVGVILIALWIGQTFIMLLQMM